jgi:hypothetical protein
MNMMHLHVTDFDRLKGCGLPWLLWHSFVRDSKVVTADHLARFRAFLSPYDTYQFPPVGVSWFPFHDFWNRHNHQSPDAIQDLCALRLIPAKKMSDALPIMRGTMMWLESPVCQLLEHVSFGAGAFMPDDQGKDMALEMLFTPLFVERHAQTLRCLEVPSCGRNEPLFDLLQDLLLLPQLERVVLHVDRFSWDMAMKSLSEQYAANYPRVPIVVNVSGNWIMRHLDTHHSMWALCQRESTASWLSIRRNGYLQIEPGSNVLDVQRVLAALHPFTEQPFYACVGAYVDSFTSMSDATLTLARTWDVVWKLCTPDIIQALSALAHRLGVQGPSLIRLLGFSLSKFKQFQHACPCPVVFL